MFIKRIFKSYKPRAIVWRFWSALRARPKLLLCLLGLSLLLICLGIFSIRDEAARRLAEERARLARQEFIPFEKTVRSPLARTEIRFLQNTENTRAIVRFSDSYFAATDGGLVQYSREGRRERHYTVLDGLTESDLTSLELFDSKLFIGTQTQGLLSFDGERFESYRWLDREPQAITSLLADNGRLLIGTFNGGLIEFDGSRFTELRTGADHTRLHGVNCLIKYGPRLYVGTFDDGLWLLDAGRWLHFNAADGLDSNRVVGVAESGETVFVATDFGIASTTADNLLTENAAQQQKRFRPLITLPSVTTLIQHNDLLLFSKDDGSLVAIEKEAAERHLAPVKTLNWPKPDDLSGSRLTVIDDKLWLLGDRGIWRTDEDGFSQARAYISLTPFSAGVESPVLASNLISSLALDRSGRLWAGNFRRGIDVLTTEGKKITHLESEAVREINFLLTEQDASLLAATSQGIVGFDDKFHSTNLSKADGLPGNSVMNLALLESVNSYGKRHDRASDLVVATNRGLAFSQQGRWRTLTTVQGLPSDQIYATLFFKRALFVGTLGGLAEVESNRVVRVFKDSNSKLTHNWVTALCAAGERLFIGTYGGGVFELAASNDLYGFSEEMGRAVVNPNAMWSDGERLFVGTLDGAWVFDLHAQKWTHLKDELPSKTVLSITGDERSIYFGTTNGIARVEKSYLTQM